MLCPNCGYYCLDNTVYCCPPIDLPKQTLAGRIELMLEDNQEPNPELINKHYNALVTEFPGIFESTTNLRYPNDVNYQSKFAPCRIQRYRKWYKKIWGRLMRIIEVSP